MTDQDNYLVFSRGYTLHKVPYAQTQDYIGERLLYKPSEWLYFLILTTQLRVKPSCPL